MASILVTNVVQNPTDVTPTTSFTNTRLSSVTAFPVSPTGIPVTTGAGDVEFAVGAVQTSPQLGEEQYQVTLFSTDVLSPANSYWRIEEIYTDGHKVVRKVKPLSAPTTQTVSSIIF